MPELQFVQSVELERKRKNNRLIARVVVTCFADCKGKTVIEGEVFQSQTGLTLEPVRPQTEIVGDCSVCRQPRHLKDEERREALEEIGRQIVENEFLSIRRL